MKDTPYSTLSDTELYRTPMVTNKVMQEEINNNM